MSDEQPTEAVNGSDWTYLAGATPLGALVCSKDCLAIALQRHNRTGRVDSPNNIQ